MLEVVFSDSVAGAMLVAIGHQHSIGGATAVIFANEDGEQNATIIPAKIKRHFHRRIARKMGSCLALFGQ